jgi:hypothetical protein
VGTTFNYKESLDTTYTGGYIGVGGEYRFGFVPIIGSAAKASEVFTTGSACAPSSTYAPVSTTLIPDYN